MPPPSTRSLESEPESPSQFSVLPSPAPVPEPIPAPPLPEPEAVVAFTPDQPPPLKIEEPAVAVAVLRATVAGPQELPAVAMATANIQPPQMFRPVVLPPPISGIAPAPPINLAPTLAGPGSIAGMISLSPAADAHSPANFDVRGIQSKPATQPLPTEAPRAEISPPPPPPPVEAEATPAAPTESHDEPTPTLKSFVKRLFTPPAADTPPAVSPPAPPPEAGEKSRVPPPQVAPNAPPVFPAPNLSEPAPPTAPMPAPFQLHLPRLPQSAPLAAPSVEHAPPALPISPFDQHSLQSIFMTEETLDLSKISRLAAALPGIQACIIATQGKSYSSGNLPEGFDLNALRGLAPQVGAAADRLPIGQLKNFTLYGQDYSISFFERTSVCICAIHRARSFVPGVREKLVAVVDELARKGNDE